MTATTVAHAFGTLQALPGPTAVWLLAAVGGFVATATYLTHRDADRQSPPLKRGWPAPGAAPAGGTAPPRTSTAAARPAMAALRIAGAICLAGLVLLALTGPARPDRSPLPRTLLILILGGVVPLSLLLGPFYGAVNPLRPLAAGLRRAAGLQERPLDARLGRWPGAGFLAVGLFAAQHALDAPVAVAIGLLAYVGVQVVLGAVYGGGWFAVGDGLEVLSDVVGAAAPIGPRPDGTYGGRDVVVALSRAPVPPGTVAVVAVVVGSTWLESIADTVAFTSVGAAALATVAACAVAGGLLQLGAVRDFLLAAVLPLAGAYGLQLVTVPLLLDGQIGVAQLSDPLGRAPTPPAGVAAGAELPVPDALVGAALLVVFVGLHLVALAVAHRSALLRFDLRGARAVQFPLRIVLLVSLLLGLWLPTIGDEEFTPPPAPATGALGGP